MLPISQPFSCPGPTRMSHRIMARKSLQRIDTHLDLACSSQEGASALCFGLMALANLLRTFRAGLVLG
jgi:hypothetical protein